MRIWNADVGITIIVKSVRRRLLVVAMNNSLLLNMNPFDFEKVSKELGVKKRQLTEERNLRIASEQALIGHGFNNL